MSDSPTALTKATASPNPINQFHKWFEQALAGDMTEEQARAMNLATATADGAPTSRIVLLKSFDEGGFTFYTNYQSRKGKQLAQNPRACLLFYWPSLWRQVRIEGPIEKISELESEEYFSSRPLGSKIGAWASNQSQVVTNRDALERRFQEFSEKFGSNVPRPPHWGGYRVRPQTIEFWQGRENRLHDRLEYRLREDGSWQIERLAP